MHTKAVCIQHFLFGPPSPGSIGCISPALDLRVHFASQLFARIRKRRRRPGSPMKHGVGGPIAVVVNEPLDITLVQ